MNNIERMVDVESTEELGVVALTASESSEYLISREAAWSASRP